MVHQCNVCSLLTSGSVSPCVLSFDASDASQLPEVCPIDDRREAEWEPLPPGTVLKVRQERQPPTTNTGMDAIVARAADDWFAAEGQVTVRQAFIAGARWAQKQHHA